MSRATGAVRFSDGTVRWCMYCGTSDRVWSTLFDSAPEAWAAYTAGDVDMHIDPAGEVEPVEIAQDYGGGAHWPGRAARNAVAGPLEPWSDEAWDTVVDGLPDWFHPRFD